MALNPQFASTPRLEFIQIATANTNKDGSGTIANLFTAGSSGSRVEEIIIKAVGNTTAGQIRFFVNDGSSNRLIWEVDVPAQTGTGINQTFSIILGAESFLPLILKPNQSLRVSTHNAETFNVFAIGGDF